MNNLQKMTGGTFNLLYGRDDEQVKREVIRLLSKHDLDFLCLQEASNYFRVLNSIKGYTYLANRSEWAASESTILVKDTHTFDKEKFIGYGDGWYRYGKKYKGPRPGMWQARLDGWLFVRSLHLPTPSFWSNGEIDDRTPGEREDDLIDGMNKLRRWFSYPSRRNARIAAGDWNEPISTRGEYSPQWLAEKTGATLHDTVSTQGHGRIDWVAAKGVEVTRIFKDTDVREGSDHEPVIFHLTRNRKV